jgi:hypothetical protein
VDFDGDGNPDILSGSWPGELYLFRGKGKGEFAPAEQLKDKAGKPINRGSASTVFAADWNGDGKLDLLIGDQQGNVWLMLNEGDRKVPVYAGATKVAADGKDIVVNHGDSHPVAADWDRDGKLDLLVGTGAGGVMWYRNVGDKGDPKLATGKAIVADSPMAKDWARGLKDGEWGTRAKIWVADWDGDGWPDLLLGDFGATRGPEPKLTDADRAEIQKAQAKQQEVVKRYEPLAQKYGQLSKPAANETPEQAQKRQAELKELQAQMQEVGKELGQLYQILQRGQAQLTYTGNVWLFLRTPDKTARAGGS